MEQASHFCTCPDVDCPLHPGNHDQGCDLCIQKNLTAGEVPSCFFLQATTDLDAVQDFSREGFAALCLGEKGKAG